MNERSGAGILTVLTILCISFLPESAMAQNDGPAAKPDPIIETGEGRPADNEIDQRLEEVFQQIDGLENVFVSVSAGVVTLKGEVADGALSGRAEALAGRVAGVVTVRNEIRETVEVGERLAPVLDRLVGRSWQLLSYLPLFAVAVIVFAVIGIFGWWITGRSWPWSRIAPNAFIADLIRQIVRLVFLGLALVLSLEILGASALLGTIAGAAGIVGLAVGFAVRDTVENYIASILLSVRQPFRPNDHILIEGKEGRVVRLTSRATIILSLDGNHIRIPNALVFKGVITNFTRNPERRFEFELGVDADSNLNEATALGVATLRGLDFILDDPGPVAWIKNVGDSNIVIWYSGWINQIETDFARARSEAMRLTKLALENNGFSLPEPIYRLRFEENIGALVTPSPDSKVTKQSPPGRKETVQPINTAADDTVRKMVEEDRSESRQSDLLSADAPTELE